MWLFCNDLVAGPKKSGEKIDNILSAALRVLSKNGYEQTTINDIADEAKISRGLLHYYFKDKEDLVARALEHGFEPMWDMSVGSLSSSKSAEDLVDRMIEVLKKNVQENPDFTALLFEMWVSGRRSSRIHKVFKDGFEEAISRLAKLLELASLAGIIKINASDAEGLIRIILGLYHGLAMQLLTNPDKIKDKKIWVPVKRTLLMAFER